MSVNTLTQEQIHELNRLAGQAGKTALGSIIAQLIREVNSGGGFAYAIGEYAIQYGTPDDNSTGLFPSKGGTGPEGAVKRGNSWVIAGASAGTEMDGIDVENGDTIVALVDNPGQDADNWLFLQGNIGYTAENSANKVQNLALPSSVQYPSTQAVRDYLGEDVVTAGASIANGIDVRVPVVAPANQMTAGEFFMVEILVHFFITSGVTVPTWGTRKILATYWCDGLNQRSYSAQVIASENSVESLSALTIEAALSTTGITGVPCLRINNDTGQSLTYKMVARYTKSNTLAGNDSGVIAENFYYPAHMVGRLIYHSGITALPGTVLADGSARSRTGFRRLFAKIGTTWGAGNGSTTFGTPDLRGLFVRGAGTHGTMAKAAGGNFAGGSVGSTSNDSMHGHYHDWYVGNTSSSFGHTDSNNQIAPADNAGGRKIQSTVTGAKDQINSPKSDGTNGTPRTGDETKPASASLLPCIVY